MLKTMRLLFGALSLVAIAHHPMAATIKHQKNYGVGNDVIRLDGEIQAGDAQKLKDVLMGLGPLDFGGRLVVNSPGGSVDEAIQVARIVSATFMGVDVYGGGYCASACFMIFLAGIPHTAVGTESVLQASAESQQRLFNGGVGLHRPSLAKGEALAGQQLQGMRQVSAYLEGQSVPRRLIDLMMTRPSTETYWLTADDLAELGAYPPEHEEFLIQKCRNERIAVEKILGSRTRADARQLKTPGFQRDAALVCVSSAIADAHMEARKMLKAGKLPR